MGLISLPMVITLNVQPYFFGNINQTSQGLKLYMILSSKILICRLIHKEILKAKSASVLVFADWIRLSPWEFSGRLKMLYDRDCSKLQHMR